MIPPLRLEPLAPEIIRFIRGQYESVWFSRALNAWWCMRRTNTRGLPDVEWGDAAEYCLDRAEAVAGYCR